MSSNPGDRTPHVRRLVEMLGMEVRAPDGALLGRVNDLRLSPGQRVTGVTAELVVDGLVVANRHAGSMLGYDRRAEQGPWLVRAVVRALHRHTGYLPMAAVTEIDWDADVMQTSAEELLPLEGRINSAD
jgi:hypothetical protein